MAARRDASRGVRSVSTISILSFKVWVFRNGLANANRGVCAGNSSAAFSRLSVHNIYCHSQHIPQRF
jgi:hypothetical protein